MKGSTSIERPISARKASLSNQTQARHINAGIHRRSTNACQRCKRRKIKCHYNSENSHSKCVACSRASSECLFDAPPDGVLRGHAYVATLEARVQTLETQLRARTSQQYMKRTQSSLTPDTTCSEQLVHERETPALTHLDQPSGAVMDGSCQGEQLSGQGNLPQNNDSRETASSQCSRERVQLQGTLFGLPNEPQTSISNVTILDMVHGRAFDPGLEGEALPALPSSNRARTLLGTVYLYTQARYCIIDWTQLREWHRDRGVIAYISTEGPVSSQIGAFFIWIVYAIGARLVPDPENSTEAYFARARLYLPAVMALQDMVTVQALLSLVQYYFRAPTETPIWHLVGLALRLCIKLRYHRKVTSSPVAPNLDPYTIELRKRFFWCAYCFDRSFSILSKLPFGISDSDIDVETPIDIDDACKDQQKIRELQLRQAAGGPSHEDGIITTMTAALHHLQVYRIRSKILTNFTGPHAQTPSLSDVERLLSELDQWKQQAPRKQDSRCFPQQNPDRVQATYLQAVLLLIRPILMGNVIDSDLIRLCVEFAADACQSAKVLSLNPQIPPDRITVYHCFYCGITLLQCLAIKPTALTPRCAHQAISACLSALAVYTRVLPAVAPFLRLFEDLSNLLVCDDHGSEIHPSPEVRNVLNRIVSSDPSETPGILHLLSSQETQQATFGSTPRTLEMESMANQYDSILGGQSSVVLDTEFPFEMPLDLSPLYAPDAEITDLWTEPWLNPSSADFS
ncbi:uncharacterized protein ASPGLDRAFT_51083 [Aspergillus glaucus CBS 516.65]|uniref:Zn(2)-C6 fungal-type domain-containing protein n=1 Tax=Aspergillus glaucus CBS 516.65 TaxID=1160497 RepID=A0A1L9V9T7_ASPGL|nr:hypothetical protein ASPGLDRAFT_51083 [Aspergillus glaucus CBS 516.65]OJJ80669.1 hypothetical protein ASPGLDRAFT_51083 [Aspergillus glaucus CBS 516.65]